MGLVSYPPTCILAGMRRIAYVLIGKFVRRSRSMRAWNELGFDRCYTTVAIGIRRWMTIDAPMLFSVFGIAAI